MNVSGPFRFGKLREFRENFGARRSLVVSIVMFVFLFGAIVYYSLVCERSIVVQAVTDELEIEFDGTPGLSQWVLGDFVLCRRSALRRRKRSSSSSSTSTKPNSSGISTKPNENSLCSSSYTRSEYKDSHLFWGKETQAIIRRSQTWDRDGYELSIFVKKTNKKYRRSYIQRSDQNKESGDTLQSGDVIIVQASQSKRLGRLPLSGKISIGSAGSGFGTTEILKSGTYQFFDTLPFRSPLMVKEGNLSIADKIRFVDSTQQHVRSIGAIAPLDVEPRGLSVVAVSQSNTDALAIVRLGLESHKQYFKPSISDRVIKDPFPAFLSIMVGYIALFLTLYRASQTLFSPLDSGQKPTVLPEKTVKKPRKRKKSKPKP